MEAKLSLCGFRCDLCLAYQPNIEAHPENQQLLSDGWQTYFGFRLQPDQIVCAGCSHEGSVTLDSDCPVRPCVIDRGHETCAACEDFGCEKLVERLIRYEDMVVRHGKPIPNDDRQRFIFPYENAERLEKLRKGYLRHQDNPGGG